MYFITSASLCLLRGMRQELRPEFSWDKQEAAVSLDTAAASCVGELEKFMIRVRALKVFLLFLSGV